ncbi:MAG: hypothetical protein Q8Q52_00270 [Acidimicrobiia bacterium]|nr:hypothetical protein [Acidimicrobiia bacterium]
MDFWTESSKPIPPFAYSWPDMIEHFDPAWQVNAVLSDGRRVAVRHGIAPREVYGRFRVHTVTFVEGQPRVEGVAADDYDHSGLLVSRIKRADNKIARARSQLPPGLETFLIVDHRQAVDAPHSPRCLAVAIRADDPQAWARYAVHRALLHRRL